MGYLQLILFAGLAAIVFAGKHAYDNGKRAEGRAELLPTIQKLTMRLDADVEAFSKVAASFSLIKQNSDRVKQQVLKAAVIKAARNKAAKVRIEYIDRIVPAGANECERVFDVIDKGAER